MARRLHPHRLEHHGPITRCRRALTDGTVTVREGDTMTQERVKIEDLRALIDKKVSLNNLLRSL